MAPPTSVYKQISPISSLLLQMEPTKPTERDEVEPSGTPMTVLPDPSRLGTPEGEERLR